MLNRPAPDGQIKRQMTMDVVLAKWPEVIPVLLKNRMHCVGCLLAPFHDITDAAIEHGLDEDKLFEEFQDIAASGG